MIPSKVRKSLDDAGVLARCLEYDRLIDAGAAMSNPIAARAYFDKAAAILTARSAFQLASEMAARPPAVLDGSAQLRRVDLAELTADEITAARRAGQLDALLGGVA
jgi:hypothetical protein